MIAFFSLKKPGNQFPGLCSFRCVVYGVGCLRAAGIECVEVEQEVKRVDRTVMVGIGDRIPRVESVEEGEEILRSGAISHNYFWFYRDAIETSLNTADWEGAERYAAALEDYTRPEPLPWCDFFIARGRALVAVGGGRRGAEIAAELGRLRGLAERAGIHTAIPGRDAALRATGEPDGATR